MVEFDFKFDDRNRIYIPKYLHGTFNTKEIKGLATPDLLLLYPEGISKDRLIKNVELLLMQIELEK